VTPAASAKAPHGAFVFSGLAWHGWQAAFSAVDATFYYSRQPVVFPHEQ
jgi:hypothetical protein